jgi:hypothetical protein
MIELLFCPVHGIFRQELIILLTNNINYGILNVMMYLRKLNLI